MFSKFLAFANLDALRSEDKVVLTFGVPKLLTFSHINIIIYVFNIQIGLYLIFEVMLNGIFNIIRDTT